MPTPDLSEFADFAATIAAEARDIGQKYFRQLYDVSSKSDGTPVTIADLEIEQRARLLIAEQYPDHGVYGEEEGEDNTHSEWLWVIDPIDGTKSFATGKRTFGCLIALLHEQRCEVVSRAQRVPVVLADSRLLRRQHPAVQPRGLLLRDAVERADLRLALDDLLLDEGERDFVGGDFAKLDGLLLLAPDEHFFGEAQARS